MSMDPAGPHARSCGNDEAHAAHEWNRTEPGFRGRYHCPGSIKPGAAVDPAQIDGGWWFELHEHAGHGRHVHSTMAQHPGDWPDREHEGVRRLPREYAIATADRPGYDSTPDTLRHALRVGALMTGLIVDLIRRSSCHDRSKTEEPELSVFNEYTPELATMTYGSPEYKAALAGMGDGLTHHYAVNRHHPEHFENGVNGMTLVDLVEMLADWKAATERHADGDLARSFAIQWGRFEIDAQLAEILQNTAKAYGWL